MLTLNSTNINIQEPIAIYICHCNTSAPVGIARHTCFLRDVLKLKISFVQIEFVTTMIVCSKINIGQSIIINVSDSHTSSIVVIEVIQNTESCMFFECIYKVDIGMCRRHFFEEIILFTRKKSYRE